MTAKPRVVCFGEVLLRLSAIGNEPLLNTPRLEARFAGVEANVAVSLTRLGSSAAIVTVLPDNVLGRAARDELRRHGANTDHVRFAHGRMGLYFLAPGAVLRPSEILYDRAASAFAMRAGEIADWQGALTGAEWLHVSGITPALSEAAAWAVNTAVAEARRLGVKVSFDGNDLARLWTGREREAPPMLRGLAGGADLAFVDERDIGLMLGASPADFAAAAEAAFAAFPRLGRVATTVRVQHSVGRHDLSAVMCTRRGGLYRTRTFALDGIVDRIGAGDAFAAGLLHGLLRGMDDQSALDFALAACCLKHSYPGDFNFASEADVRALVAREENAAENAGRRGATT